jgi:hypothetical protein
MENTLSLQCHQKLSRNLIRKLLAVLDVVVVVNPVNSDLFHEYPSGKAEYRIA